MSQLMLLNAAWLGLGARPPFFVLDEKGPQSALKSMYGTKILFIGPNHSQTPIEPIVALINNDRANTYCMYVGRSKHKPDMIDFDQTLPPDSELGNFQAALSTAIRNREPFNIEVPSCATQRSANFAVDHNGRDVNAEVTLGTGHHTSFDPNKDIGCELLLTRRQLTVLKLISVGLSNKDIARELGISPHTVGAHIGAILRCMNAKNRLQAIKLAESLSLIKG